MPEIYYFRGGKKRKLLGKCFSLHDLMLHRIRMEVWKSTPVERQNAHPYRLAQHASPHFAAERGCQNKTARRRVPNNCACPPGEARMQPACAAGRNRCDDIFKDYRRAHNKNPSFEKSGIFLRLSENARTSQLYKQATADFCSSCWSC